jgi:D-alanyl-D-alanine carboxypeptidase/D-alanyl-D-alanine-endopeptidase (penicillin-binding protein 4)
MAAMSRFRLLRRLAVVWLCAGFISGCAAAALDDGTLPAGVQAALAAAGLPPEALTAWVSEVGPQGHYAPRLAWRAKEAVNPASLMKLYSTGAALELLGPAWTWTTPVLTAGPIDEHGALAGDLVIQGRGDPTLTLERVWLLLRTVRQRGVREVRGDIVLDGSAFQRVGGDPAAFDGEPLRPYNVQPDALLLNLKSITLSFVPDVPRGIARISADAPLAGVQVDAAVALTADDCADWRAAVRADFSDPARLRFSGRYPVACGEKSWPLAYAEPASYNARLVEALWLELGGRLAGRVRDGVAPPDAVQLLSFGSPPLAAVVRDINKFSNNVMAQQLFLSLGLNALEPTPAPASGVSSLALDPPIDPGASLSAESTGPVPQAEPPATAEAARARLERHVRERTACTAPEVVIDNGSGLSRDSRSSARCLGAWLQALWASPLMPELMSSLPLPGVDGTARRPGREWGAALGRAHLKTGSLRDAAGLAGYVIGASGRRYAFVAMLNHPNANAGRSVLDALVDWTARESVP